MSAHRGVRIRGAKQHDARQRPRRFQQSICPCPVINLIDYLFLLADRSKPPRSSLPLYNPNLRLRQAIQLVHQRIDLLVRHIDLALQALTRCFAGGGLLLSMQV